MLLAKTGVPAASDLAKVIPSEERLKKGAVAIIECFQSIPCNPCQFACPRGAIKEFADINDIPKIDFDLCDGCGTCISKCPGLAIFVVDATYGAEEALVKIPYEFLPLPAKGDRVAGLNREGKEVCEAEVVRVQSAKGLDKTPIIWLSVPKDYMMEVRHIRLKGGAVS